jgi:hypothetical protein
MYLKRLTYVGRLITARRQTGRAAMEILSYSIHALYNVQRKLSHMKNAVHQGQSNFGPRAACGRQSSEYFQ